MPRFGIAPRLNSMTFDDCSPRLLDLRRKGLKLSSTFADTRLRSSVRTLDRTITKTGGPLLLER
jgi:hypothetical protein